MGISKPDGPDNQTPEPLDPVARGCIVGPASGILGGVIVFCTALLFFHRGENSVPGCGTLLSTYGTLAVGTAGLTGLIAGVLWGARPEAMRNAPARAALGLLGLALVALVMAYPSAASDVMMPVVLAGSVAWGLGSAALVNAAARALRRA